ncbi:hypothetical protein QVD17_39167 [Tagetes erecta]|uniref:GRF-type domain-containing protein n=1 Tax=Tagetes erecta TaxID=13708 RepID=A0AAD8JQ85_TARER|nr:hypothetical protein QVD17_39167 [Tagetes erecta]
MSNSRSSSSRVSNRSNNRVQSHSFSANTSQEIICSCGSLTTIRTSWTAANPGRRFHCCISGCGFVEWADLDSILLGKLNEQRVIAAAKAKEARNLKIILV